MQYEKENGKVVAILSTGQKIIRGEPLPLDYPVYYDYLYFVDDRLVVCDIQGNVMQLLSDLASMNKADKNSTIYSAHF